MVNLLNTRLTLRERWSLSLSPAGRGIRGTGFGSQTWVNQGDSLDTKYDCSRFHAICFIVASCNGRLYLSSVKRTGWEPYDRKNKMGYLRRSWKVNGLSVYGPVRPVCHHGMFLLFPRGFVAIECYVGRSDFPRLSNVL